MELRSQWPISQELFLCCFSLSFLCVLNIIITAVSQCTVATLDDIESGNCGNSAA